MLAINLVLNPPNFVLSNNQKIKIMEKSNKISTFILTIFLSMFCIGKGNSQINEFNISTALIGDTTMLSIENTATGVHRLFQLNNDLPGLNQDMIEMKVNPFITSQFIEFEHIGGPPVGKINSDGSASFEGLNLGIISSNLASEMLRMSISGDDGISITGDDTGHAFIKLGNSSEHEIYNDHTSNDLVFNAANSENISFRDGNIINLTLNGSGDLGLGTATPASKFDMHTFGYDGLSIRGDGSSDTYLRVQNGANMHYIFSDKSKLDKFTMQSEVNRDIGFNTGTANRIHIESSNGNVGVNTESPDTKLHLIHEDVSTDGFKLENEVSGEDWLINVAGINDNLQLRFGGIFKGQFNNATGSYTIASDRRLKKDIDSMPSVLDKIKKLRPAQYKIRNSDSGETYFGLIAQELKEIFPNTVIVSSQPNSAVGEIQDLHSVSYIDLIPVLIKGMQEQQIQIEQQKQQIEMLLQSK